MKLFCQEGLKITAHGTMGCEISQTSTNFNFKKIMNINRKYIFNLLYIFLEFETHSDSWKLIEPKPGPWAVNFKKS
jgi:hypothetical protein